MSAGGAQDITEQVKEYLGRAQPLLGGKVENEHHAFLLVPAQAIVGEFLKTFKEFPPRQRPASFSIDQALEKARKSQETMATSGGAGVK